MARLAPRDALMYWTAAKLPNDQFLLYCFESPAAADSALVAAVANRASRIPDLCLRIRDVPRHLDYPHWVAGTAAADNVVLHRLGEPTWDACRDAVATVLGSVLDARHSPWRLHVFAGVRGAPECEGPAVVALLQLSHALADGKRAAGIARALFGVDALEKPSPVDTDPSPATLVAQALVRTPVLTARMFGRAIVAARAYRQSVRLADSGELPPRSQGWELLPFNRPDDRHDVRVIVLPVDDVRGNGFTVTVTLLTALSLALSRYLGNEVPAGLGVEVTVARSGKGQARNNYHNVGVNLSPGESDLVARAAAIRDALAERRVRADHPSITVQARAGDVTPAPLVRLGVAQFDIAVLPPTVAGHTVVTSVDRGPADLTFGGGPVRFTTGFPALSPAMGLTHGIFSIGGTLSIGIHSSPAALPDPVGYESLLRGAVREVVAALRIARKV